MANVATWGHACSCESIRAPAVIPGFVPVCSRKPPGTLSALPCSSADTPPPSYGQIHLEDHNNQFWRERDDSSVKQYSEQIAFFLMKSGKMWLFLLFALSVQHLFQETAARITVKVKSITFRERCLSTVNVFVN